MSGNFYMNFVPRFLNNNEGGDSMPIRIEERAFLFFGMIFMLSFQGMAYEVTKKVIAHRGLSSQYPENTIISFRWALETKADYIECDVHLTSDHVPVVIHDEDLSRTTNGHGRVGDYPLTALRQLTAGYMDKFGTKFYKEKIPTLREVLDLVLGGSKKSLLIEIKYRKDDPAYRERVGRIVYETVMERYSDKKEQFAFISFDHLILKKIRELDETVTIGPIFAKLPQEGSLADQALELGADRVIFSKKLLTDKRLLQKTDRVKHFIYTLLPQEFEHFEQFEGLYGFATDFADRIE